jgi:hypothetical protein
MDDTVDVIISLMEYAQSRYSLVLLMVFLLAFTKSCAVISLLIPAPPGCCCSAPWHRPASVIFC